VNAESTFFSEKRKKKRKKKGRKEEEGAEKNKRKIKRRRRRRSVCRDHIPCLTFDPLRAGGGGRRVSHWNISTRSRGDKDT